MLPPVFDSDGYSITEPVLTDAGCGEVIQRLSCEQAVGARNLLQFDWIAALGQSLSTHPAVAAALPPGAVAVQCTAFEKSPERNWLVTLHQDLSIPVAERVAQPGLTGWSVKDGVLYVQPPRAILEQLVAVRLQLDLPSPGDGSLRVIPGSHRFGRLSDRESAEFRERAGEIQCNVRRGAVLLMRPLLLHASSKLTAACVRRVLHFLFGPRELPMGLRWANAV